MASLRKRERAGKVRWQVRWRQDNREVSESFDTYAQGLKFKGLVDAAGQRYPSGWVPGRGFVEARRGLTLAEWFPRAVAARTRPSARTKADYERDFKRHVPKWLADKVVGDITREDAGLWIVELRASKGRNGVISEKTVRNVQGLLSSVLSDAVKDGHAERNPFAGQLRGHVVTRPEMVFLSAAQVEAVLAETPEFYRDFVTFLYRTGMRFSEATVASPGQVNLEARTLLVDRSWKRESGGGRVGTTKSGRSRLIGLSETLCGIVEPRLGGELLFPNHKGRRMSHGNFYARVWRPAVERAELDPAPRIHDLRHSHAAYLISKGVPLLAVSRRLGHASIAITGDVYGHLLPEVDDGIRDLT